MRARRLAKRIAVGTIVVLVAVIAAVAAVSQTAWFRDWLRRQIVTRLNTGLNGQLTLGALEGNLVQGIVVRDLRLRSEGKRILAARRVAARYDLVRLLTGGVLALRDAEVSGLALLLIEDERGWNVARLFPPQPEPEEKGGLDVILDDASVRRAAIKVVRPADVWRVRDLRLAGSARFGRDGQALTLAGLSFDMPGRNLRVAELTGKIAVDADHTLRADTVHLRTDGSELRVTAHVPGGEGDYDVALDVTTLSAAEVRRLLRAPAPASDLAATIRVRGPAAWAALEAEVTSEAGKIALDGNAGLGNPPSYDLRARLTNVNAAGLLGPAQPMTDVTGTVNVKGKGATMAQVAASVAVALQDSEVNGRRITRLTLDGGIAEQQITFQASTALDAGEAEASGTVGIAAERYDVRLTARQFDPAPLIGRPDLRAQLNATLTVIGTGFRPASARGEAHFEMTPSRIGEVQVTAATADIRAGDGRLTIDRLNVNADAVALDAAGVLGLDEHATPATGDVRYRVRAADLAPLARIVGAGPLGGSLAVEGTASGALTDLTVRATVNGKALVRADDRVGALAGTVAADAIGGARARATVDAHAEDVGAAGRHFEALQVAAQWRQQTPTSSVAHVDVRIQEDTSHRHELVADATLAASERRATITTLRLDLGDDSWRAEGTPVLVQRGPRFSIAGFALRSARGVLRLDGEAGTTGAQNLDVRFDDVDLAAFGKRLQASVEGRASGTAHLGGSAQAPTLTAHVAVDAPTIEKVRYESVVADAQVAGGRASLAARVVQEGPRQLTLDVASPVKFALAPFEFAAGGTLAGALRANVVDLAFLDPLLPQVSKLAGTLNADLALAGTFANPDVRGPLTITGGRAYVVPIGLTYDPIELRMTLEGPAASIETLRIVSREGSLTGGGGARLTADGASIDARFQLERFPLFANEFGEGVASGWIWVSGSTAAPVVEGTLSTDRFVLLVPEVLPGAVRPLDPTIQVIGPGAAPVNEARVRAASAESQEEPEAKAPKPGVYEAAAMTIQIDVPRNAWIRRSDANIELRGWITAWKKPAEELALAGEINTVRGWYSFQGKTFNIEEGSVVFTGQDFNPLLSIAAVYRAGDYTVRIKIGGTLTKPALTLESEPYLDQADILSVLLFGRPASELNKSESAGLREQALGVATSYVASELRQSVANTLGLDTLEFATGSGGLEGASLAFGRYIAPDVFVSLAHRFARQGVEELRVEYSFRPNWSVETSSDTLGDGGIDIFWKRRY